jgi:hypothetical protein
LALQTPDRISTRRYLKVSSRGTRIRAVGVGLLTAVLVFFTGLPTSGKKRRMRRAMLKPTPLLLSLLLLPQTSAAQQAPQAEPEAVAVVAPAGRPNVFFDCNGPG